MVRKKAADAPERPIDKLLSRLNANSEFGSASLAKNITASWRYIDFANPMAKLPALSLEWLFGSRGLLAGRLMQLRATYSKGKSSTMYLIYACAQMLSKAFCYHIETEGAPAPPDYMASIGCDLDELIVDEVASLEECTEKIDRYIANIRGGKGEFNQQGKLVKTKFDDPIDPAMTRPIAIGVDSVSSLGAQDYVIEDVADMGKSPQLAKHSVTWREYFRRRVSRWREAQALVMMASHETVKIEMGKAAFGGPKKTSLAQEAIGIHATYGVDVSSKPYMPTEKGVVVGDEITLTTFKNKISPRGRQLTMYLVWNHGFDLIHTDASFLLDHAGSPFTKEECYRHARGITCKPLSDSSFGSEEEFVRALYNKQDLVMSLREKLRIRGCGFEFEQKYVPSAVEVEDNQESTESDIDGVAGSPAEVPVGADTK